MTGTPEDDRVEADEPDEVLDVDDLVVVLTRRPESKLAKLVAEVVWVEPAAIVLVTTRSPAESPERISVLVSSVLPVVMKTCLGAVGELIVRD